MLNAQTHSLNGKNIRDQIRIIKKHSQLIEELKSDRHNLNDSETYDIVNQLKKLQNLLVDEILDNSSPPEIAQYLFTHSSRFGLNKTLDWSQQIHDNFDSEVIGNIAKLVIKSELCE